jgi:hypothetical protein
MNIPAPGGRDDIAVRKDGAKNPWPFATNGQGSMTCHHKWCGFDATVDSNQHQQQSVKETEMSDTHVRFANGQFSYRGQYPVSPRALGKDIVVTLLKGLPYTDFGLEPYFAIEAVRHTGRTGRLDFSIQQDDFPFGWEGKEAASLREQADLLVTVASNIRDSDVNRPLEELGGLRISDNVLLSADKILQHAGSLYGDGSGGSLKARYLMPFAKLGWSRAQPRELTWQPKAQAWSFGGYMVGVALLGRMIVLRLLQGHELVLIGKMCLSVNFLADMVRLTGENAGFHEVVDRDCNLYSASVFAQSQR